MVATDKSHRPQQKMKIFQAQSITGRTVSLVCVALVAVFCLLGPVHGAGQGKGRGGGNGAGPGNGSGSGGDSPSETYSILPLNLQVEGNAARKWDSGEREPCSFEVSVTNPSGQNPDVRRPSYTLRAELLSEKAAIYTFSCEGTDITDDILSESGWSPERWEPYPGGSVTIHVTVVPVGPANEPRKIRLFLKSQKASLSNFIPIAVPADRLGPPDEKGYEFDLYRNQPGSSKGLINVGAYSCGTPEVVEAIEHGYDGAIQGGDGDSLAMAGANPGFRWGPVRRALGTRRGKKVIVPVYDSVEGNGANAQYQITGVAQCKIPDRNVRRPVEASLLNYWDDLQSSDFPTSGGGTIHESVDLSVSVTGSPLQLGHWEEVH